MKKSTKAILGLACAFFLGACSQVISPEDVKSIEESQKASAEASKSAEEEAKKSSEAPAASSEKPAPVSSEPAPVSSEEPPVSSEEPIVSSEEPVVSSEEPIVSSEEPASEQSHAPTHTVTFENTDLEPIQVEEGALIEAPEAPEKEGYDFKGWYADEYFFEEFDFTVPMGKGAISIYAYYEEIIESSEEPELVTLYFRDATWWNKDAAFTVVQFDEGDPVFMEYGRFVPVESASIGYNYWHITIPEGALSVTFYRGYLTDEGFDISGPNTGPITLADRGDNNMYDIKDTVADWDGGTIVGTWGVYDPTDQGGDIEPTSSEEPVADGWYIVGAGSFASKDWDIAGGIALEANPGNPEDKGMKLGVSFTEGDVFKVTDGTTWFGFEKVEQENHEPAYFVGDDDNNGGENIKCNVTGTYNVYVNKDGNFWIEPASVEPGSSEEPVSSEEPLSSEGEQKTTGWYLVGKGSIFASDWNTDGGVALFENPGNPNDKGMILGIAIQEGDVFQVSDGKAWYGWNKVSQEDGDGTVTNAAKAGYFDGQDNGYGQKTNIICTMSGTFDIFVNEQGNFWIQLAA